MTNLAEIIEQVRSKRAQNTSQFLPYAAEMDMGLLARQYQEIRSKAPRRHLKNLKYLFERSGIPSSSEGSNRYEDHLGIALYHKFRKPDAMPLPDRQRLEILDYQVPLYAAEPYEGVGTIDLLGLIDEKRLSVLELKWRGGHAPLAGTLQALVYAALLEPNLADISKEMVSAGYKSPDLHALDIMVLGRTDYWQVYKKYDKTWLEKLAPTLLDIARTLTLGIRFIELKSGSLEMGHSGLLSKLDGHVRAEPLFSSKERQ